jgi:succinoglycan biosynthesis protein ExoA
VPPVVPIEYLAVDPEEASAQTSATVDVSVLTPVLNEEAHIRTTVASMREQRFPGEVEFLFVDGDSDDRTRAILLELAEEDPRIRVLRNPHRTTAYALNIGLAAARGRFVARMDGHTSYPPDYLALGVERLARGDVVWVAGPQIPRGGGVWSRRVTLALESGLASIGSRRWGRGSDPSAPAEVELDTGVFTGIMPREVLEAHGGWNPGWPINQDSELAARVLAAGGRIVQLPAMGAGYVPRDSLRALARQYFRYGLYRGKTSRHHPASMRRSMLMAPGLVLALVGSVAAPRPLRGPARAAAASYFLAVGAVSVRVAADDPARAKDAATLPLVFLVMHGTWGAGFLLSSFRDGPPIGALMRAAGLRRR